MTPTHNADTPLRRSEVGSFKTPLQTPAINDDEEERRSARNSNLHDSSTISTVEQSENLINCLKIYQENKLSKENAWSISLIDTFSALIKKHHKSVQNFQVVGSTLEASSKVYCLRVDSVHMDVMRMSSGLGKQKISEIENDVDYDASTNIEEAGTENNDNAKQSDGKKKLKRKRKQLSTVTKNKDTINAKLETMPFTDVIFAKLNSFVGNINSPNRLLQNMLPTIDSELRLRSNYKYWDSTSAAELEHSEEYNYDDLTTHEVKIGKNLKKNSMMRPKYSGYVITNTPAEEEEKEDIAPEKSLNNSQLAVAFDINATVEQLPSEENNVLDVDMAHSDFDELTEEDHIAITACKGLRRKTVIIEDMRPIDATTELLEYSYRPLDNINQFWAGPSHWKFKKPRKTSLSLHLVSSNPTADNKTAKKKIKNRIEPLSFNPIEFEDLFMKSSDIKLKKVNVYKKWDSKKIKLPTDLKLDRNRFDIFLSALGLSVQESKGNSTPDIPIGNYNYDNPTDKNYCSNIMVDDTDTDTEIGDNCLPTQEDQDPTMHDKTVEFIDSHYEGAPNRVEKIILPYAKTAKVIDMKQLKACCWRLISMKARIDTEKENNPTQSKGNSKGIISFAEIYQKLPLMLTKNMAENMTPSVAFYSILHLTNEHNLTLIQDKSLNNFQIGRLEE